MNGGDEAVAAPVDPPQPLEWKFSQVFGERTAGEEVQEGIYKYIYYIMFSIFFLVMLSICENCCYLCLYLDPSDILWKVLGLGFVLGVWIHFGSWVVENL